MGLGRTYAGVLHTNGHEEASMGQLLTCTSVFASRDTGACRWDDSDLIVRLRLRTSTRTGPPALEGDKY